MCGYQAYLNVLQVLNRASNHGSNWGVLLTKHLFKAWHGCRFGMRWRCKTHWLQVAGTQCS